MCAGREPADTSTSLRVTLLPDPMASAFRYKGTQSREKLSILMLFTPTQCPNSRTQPLGLTVTITMRVNSAFSLLEKNSGFGPTPVAPRVAQRASQRQDSAKREGDRAQVHTYHSGYLLHTPAGRGSGICPVPLGHMCHHSGMAGSHKGLNRTGKRQTGSQQGAGLSPSSASMSITICGKRVTALPLLLQSLS